MICRQCLQRLARTNRARQATPAARSFSRTATRPAQAVTTQTTTATNARPEGHPAAISTSAAQPFSTPLTPTASEKDAVSANAAPTVKSSVPAGTVLRGLNFMKNQQDPVALEDSEYPPWLWTVLSKKGDADGGAAGGEGDLFSKSKKQRRLAAKALRKQQLLNPEALAPKVPLHEQTIDLPSGDGTTKGAQEAVHARAELTKAMREKRRSKIKEDNFLREMRG